MTPISALRRQAESNPDGTAFIFGDEIWTYGRLSVEADRCARAMRAHGVQPGDRVALHSANLPELMIAYFACFRIGAIAAALNARFKTAELRPILARLNPALYLGQASLYPQIAGIEAEILPPERRCALGGAVEEPGVRRWEDFIAGVSAKTPLPPEPAADEVLLLLTTSGTTGVPKLVAHTGATMAAIFQACARIGFDEEQVVVNAMPMMHGSGFMVAMCSIWYGHPMVLLERFDADAVLDAIEVHRGSWFFGMPFAFSDMVQAQRRRPRSVGSLKLCLAGGDAVSLQLQEGFSDAFDVDLLNIWGATEVIGALIHGRQYGPVCRVAPDARIRLVDENGEDVPRGEVGELLIAGSNLALGYWKGPGELDPVSADGWYHTGDLMRLGEGDDIWFVARKKDLIIRGGSNISPLEVERVLMTHPAVREAAVVGIPDTVLGQRVAAAVELRVSAEGATAADILARTKAQLADYKVPERLAVIGKIPRNNLGKVDRRRLATMLTEPRVEPPAIALL